MRFYHIDELVMAGNEEKHVRDAMFRFWDYQYQKAKAEYFAKRNMPESMQRTNKEANEEFARSDDGIGGGFWEPPYSETDIQRAVENSKIAAKNYEEINLMRNYFLLHLFER